VFGGVVAEAGRRVASCSWALLTWGSGGAFWSEPVREAKVVRGGVASGAE
jgi:hypothetical protein